MSRSIRTPFARTAIAATTLLVAACGGDAIPQAATAPVGVAAAAHAADDAATIFAPGVISDAREQWRLTFTPDGRTAYFATSAEFFPFTRRATIYESHLGADGWSTPAVASFSGTYSDIDPFLAPDGQRLYFSSIRPVDGVPRGDIDLWMVERTTQGWGAPIHLGDAVNTPTADELYPSVDANGTLYFASGPFFPQPGRHFDIYVAERAGDGFAPRVALGPAVNTAPAPSDVTLQDAWDFNPEVSVDGKTLVFTSLRPGGRGLGDLYVSTRAQGAWTPARNLGPLVNSAADEYHPTLSRNGRELYFVRRDAVNGRRGDFYVVGTRGLALR